MRALPLSASIDISMARRNGALISSGGIIAWAIQRMAALLRHWQSSAGGAHGVKAKAAMASMAKRNNNEAACGSISIIAAKI